MESSPHVTRNDKKRVYVTELRAQDVLLGRGSGPNNNEGNIEFRNIIESLKKSYMSTSSRKIKKQIVRKALEAVKAKSGRFLSKLRKNKIKNLNLSQKIVYEVAPVDVALEKTKQALRYACYKKESHPSEKKVESNPSDGGASEEDEPGIAVAVDETDDETDDEDEDAIATERNGVKDDSENDLEGSRDNDRKRLVSKNAIGVDNLKHDDNTTHTSSRALKKPTPMPVTAAPTAPESSQSNRLPSVQEANLMFLPSHQLGQPVSISELSALPSPTILASSSPGALPLLQPQPPITAADLVAAVWMFQAPPLLLSPLADYSCLRSTIEALLQNGLSTIPTNLPFHQASQTFGNQVTNRSPFVSSPLTAVLPTQQLAAILQADQQVFSALLGFERQNVSPRSSDQENATSNAIDEFFLQLLTRRDYG